MVSANGAFRRFFSLKACACTSNSSLARSENFLPASASPPMVGRRAVPHRLILDASRVKLNRKRYSFCGSRHYGYGVAVAPISAISDTGTSDVGSMERPYLPLADESTRPSVIGRAKLSSNEKTAASLGALPVDASTPARFLGAAGISRNTCLLAVGGVGEGVCVQSGSKRP
ncbi:hypothetical protein BDP81DRAFT_190501 [Colletotrichum phormii]|uniref:Uncharacterized protein n=1 Tax=Colletotrichum phormii TaxID=359342 RepID=A0AAI9ZVS1_9PEZI|nr:uncharacterized protein BDP81DRAFT_190501 [Colletotrichum phormii]KAK1638730.1 hypothetical protein BDP81DRAFT_190501 [Colletotrichum phormii]